MNSLKILDVASRVIIVGLLTLLVSQQNHLITKVNQINTSPDVHIVRDTVFITPTEGIKVPKKTFNIVKTGSYGVFQLYTPVDTTISNQLRTAIHNYCGPSVKVNSMRRHGTKSGHCKGKAIDLEFCAELIDYLVSVEGQEWLRSHSLMFYIEGKPGSKKVGYYNWGKYQKYVFYNPRATGDHIHIEVA